MLSVSHACACPVKPWRSRSGGRPSPPQSRACSRNPLTSRERSSGRRRFILVGSIALALGLLAACASIRLTQPLPTGGRDGNVSALHGLRRPVAHRAGRPRPDAEVNERGHRVAVLAPARSTLMERLVAAGRASAAEGDVLALGPPLGRRPTRRASRALARLREERG